MSPRDTSWRVWDKGRLAWRRRSPAERPYVRLVAAVWPRFGGPPRVYVQIDSRLYFCEELTEVGDLGEDGGGAGAEAQPRPRATDNPGGAGDLEKE